MANRGEPEETTRRRFEALVVPLMDSLYRMACSMADPATAEDLVQETILHAYKAFDRFDPSGSFKAWMFKILCNASLNLYRYRRLRAVLTEAGVEADDLPERRPYVSPQAVADLGRHLGEEALSALRRLPVPYRVVFVLATFEGFRYREIADVLSVPVGTVMSRLSRARAMLREALESRAQEVRPAGEASSL